ncbi:hypothetical protein HG535_0E02660 [Zygotorulaspora mrakii]|uniref:Uncharacterized protein n=1 Tax=Zygotorulaspora mrakii TaxID=42260 RepID=A0A7H9B5X4_ZYGMR|nr:uncharacterized protein HG535_0E02660 [Zygotorulaspora mrakii]QLG73182.1 hypothetical protein HG535_0E02660 [Zygotorulaspora mrakii]
MLAKAAANALAPTIKGAVFLDNNDVKIIQYKAALYKLIEMSRLLSVLQKNLEKPSGSTIIPLINYILVLFEGPLFNVHPVMRKRFQLLSTFKISKVAHINPALNTADTPISFTLSTVDEIADFLPKYMYDRGLQFKLLGCLRSLVNNASTLYERKLRQIQIERNSRRSTDSLGRPVPFEVGSIEDILRPRESSLCLDLAVLINNREEDTSIVSMHKLQTQVLSKFVISFNTKVWPVLKNYYLQLKRFSLAKPTSPIAMSELPYWEHSLHRIYALLLRSLNILAMCLSLARQIYYSNKTYLNALRTKLLSENAFAYEETLHKLEVMCSLPEVQQTMSELLISLNNFSKPGSTHHVHPKTIVEIYQNVIAKVIPIISKLFNTLETFCTMWKFIETNQAASRLFENKTDDALNKMLTERLAVDKLSHVEKQKKFRGQVSPSPSSSNSSSRGSLTRAVGSKSGNSSTVSVLSSTASSPGKVSPLMARSESLEKNASKFSIYSSPQVSRRGSISESRTSNYASIISKTSFEQKNFTKSPLSNAKRIGRPRSSSLQSPLDDKRNLHSLSSAQSRSSSLQAEAAVNQKIVQSTMNQASLKRSEMTDKEVNGIKSSPLQSQRKSSPQSITTRDMNKSGTEVDLEGIISSRISSLSFNKDESDGLDELSKQSLDVTEIDDDSCGESEEIFCLKKVRFSGVPPMSLDEKRSPTKKGWYKKPAVLHYPPPPTAISGQKYRLRQEGMAFKTSLRDTGSDPKKVFTTMSMDVSPTKETAAQRLTSKLRDKLR